MVGGGHYLELADIGLLEMSGKLDSPTEVATRFCVGVKAGCVLAWVQVEQVVARLQNLQSTISGIQLSPVNPRHIRASRANATTRLDFFSLLLECIPISKAV